MIDKLLCTLGIHSWRYVTYDGVNYRMCTRCPKSQKTIVAYKYLDEKVIDSEYRWVDNDES